MGLNKGERLYPSDIVRDAQISRNTGTPGGTQFDNISDVKSSTKIEIGDWVTTGGYTLSGDGGGAQYLIVAAGTGVDDGGSYHDLTGISGQAELVIYKEVDVRSFGAKGDGGTDDTEALVNAKVYAISIGSILFISKDMDCKVIASLDLFGLKNIDLQGKITGSNIADEVEIGLNSQSTLPSNYFINELSTIKLKITGIKNGNITINKSPHVLLYADGDDSLKSSIAYSKFTLGDVDKLEYFSEGSAIGWINENSFFGGRIDEILIDGNYEHNNNTFYKPRLETCIITINKGFSNSFHDCRFEGSSTIVFASGTRDNIFYQSYDNNPKVLWEQNQQNYTDNGNNNLLVFSKSSAYEYKDIFEMNSYSRNFALEDITRNADDLIIGAGDVLFESGLTKITDEFGINFKSDVELFRMYIYTYNSSKTLITTDPECVISSRLTWDDIEDRYDFDVNKSEAFVGVLNSTIAEYVKIVIISGSGGTFERFNIEKMQLKGSVVNIPILSKHKQWSQGSVPTTGTWESGDIVYDNTPSSSGNIGWVCVAPGTPGTWITFGNIATL